jgi:hypothetical protein
MAKIDLAPEEIQRVVKALEHYDAYLKATLREDGTYRAVADRLKKRGGKP